MDGEAGGEGEGLAASPGAGDAGSSGAAETAEKEAWAGQCGRPGNLTRGFCGVVRVELSDG